MFLKSFQHAPVLFPLIFGRHETKAPNHGLLPAGESALCTNHSSCGAVTMFVFVF